MKKTLAITMMIFAFVALQSCKDKKEDATSEETNEQMENGMANSESGVPEPTNETKTYRVTAMPDTLSLGKKKEVSIKLMNIKMVQLTDPDGIDKGMELSYDLQVTNKNEIGGDGVYINPSDFRLVLDNGNKISHDNYNSVNVKPESTEISGENTFKIPAGTKPKELNAFYDDTRAVVKLVGLR